MIHNEKGHFHKHITTALTTTLLELMDQAYFCFHSSEDNFDRQKAFQNWPGIEKLIAWWNHPVGGWTMFPHYTEISDGNVREVLFRMKEKGDYDFVEVVLKHSRTAEKIKELGVGVDCDGDLRNQRTAERAHDDEV